MATSSKAGDKPVKAAAKTATKPKVAKAPAAKKPAVAKAAAQKTPAPRGKPQNAVPVLTPDQRRYYVEVAAYYIAERRGFHGGSQMDDWVRAEEEIDRLLREGILKP